MTTTTGTDESASTIVTPETESRLAAKPRVVPASPAGQLGLSTKFFLAAVLLVVTTLGLAIAFGSWRANQIAEQSIREALKAIPGLFGSWRGSLDMQLKETLHSLADDPGTKALLDEGVSAETIWEWTHDKAEVLKAKSVLLFDTNGRLLARSDKKPGEDVGRPFGTIKWVSEPIASWTDVAATVREGKVLSAVASVPVIAGDKERNEARLVGVLAAFFPMDEARARALKGITGGQVGFVANMARRGEAARPEVTAATDAFVGEALLAALGSDRTAMERLFSQGREVGPLDLTVAGDRRIVAAVPVTTAAGETLGAFVISRSREEETASFRQIRSALLGIGGAALLLAIPVSFAMGRRIARPLEQLARGARAIREGNLDVKLPEAGSDEVGALARSFSAMVGELKEKAALEQMIAEMRRHSAEGATPAATATLPASDAVRAGTGPHVGGLFSGRYQILSILGRGGMGAVYRALDRELEDEIALKVLTPEAFAEGTIAVQTLKQEIRLARKITHPNVVRTHDLGEVNGIRFLTMEYVPGTTLREVIDRKGAVSLGPGLQIAKQLCRGLSAVHEAGIIHRDIKPPNIMVLPNGVVKLMDFGIARAAEGNDPTGHSGQTVGTPYYMSPEQARGRDVDVRSDIYSVGVVLYEMFTRVRPIEGRDAVEVMRRHVSVEPEPISRLRPDLPDLLERVIMASLSKAPEKRPPTANDLYGALMRVA